MFRSRRLAAFAICLLLAVAHTWPLALAPGRHSLNHNADAELNAWILAWVAHQLPRDPANLFDANIFYPARDTLAFSEPLIVPALMGAPAAWLTGASPVLVHNLILIAGFALTAFAASVTIEAWTGSLAAGLVAGSAFAFNTHTLTRLAHVQGIHIYGLPIALLALDRLITGGSLRAALVLAAAMALMAYTSGYLVVFACVAIGVALAVRAGEWMPRARTVLPALTAAIVVAAIAVAPVYLPYRRVAREQNMRRSLDAVQEYSATPAGYLASAGRLHFSTWSHRLYTNDVDSFFPGVTLTLLALAGVLLVFRRVDPARFAHETLPHRVASGADAMRSLRPRVSMLLAIGAVGVVLSLGTATPVYGWLFHVFPPMQGLRVAARFGNLFLLAMAMLGGIGLALWRPRTMVAIAAIALVNMEALRAPFTYTPFKGIPGIYRLLATEPDPVVVAEQPFFPRRATFQNSPYVLASTAHWRPLMNGYSGYTPASYQKYADAFWYFPQDWAIEAMKNAGVTHVVVHLETYDRERIPVIPALEKRGDFQLMAIAPGGVRLYRLR